MKRRVGKFYLTTPVVDGGSAPEIFAGLGFVPLRAEHLMYMDKFEYIGLSPLFDQLDEGMLTPEYEIQVTAHEDPDIDSLVVSALRI